MADTAVAAEKSPALTKVDGQPEAGADAAALPKTPEEIAKQKEQDRANRTLEVLKGLHAGDSRDDVGKALSYGLGSSTVYMDLKSPKPTTSDGTAYPLMSRDVTSLLTYHNIGSVYFDGENKLTGFKVEGAGSVRANPNTEKPHVPCSLQVAAEKENGEVVTKAGTRATQYFRKNGEYICSE